jgi:hypothetical protein
MLKHINKLVSAFLLMLAISLACTVLFFVNELWRSFKSPQQPQNQTHSEHPEYKAKHDNIFADAWNWTTQDPVSFYTSLLAIFTGALVIVSVIQIRYLIRADETARMSAEAAKRAAQAANSSNDLTREIFVAEQRPWLLWRIPKITTVTKAGRHLTIKIVGGEIENIGKTPALHISDFGKFYSPAQGEAMLSRGIAYYVEHLQETIRIPFSLGNLLPTEKTEMRFGPHGIDIVSLPADEEFTLCLAFHAKYEGHLGRVSEIGTVYIVQRLDGIKGTFRIGDFNPSMVVGLVEWPGVRRIT